MKVTPEGAENTVTERIIGGAIEVHRNLGPGLLESVYEECLCYELSLAGFSFKRQVATPVNYKGVKLDCAYRLDLIVEDLVIVEIKSVEDLAPIYFSQLLTYLKSSNRRVGLLINFNVRVLKNGLRRIVNDYVGPSLTSPNAQEPSEASPRDSPPIRASAFNSNSPLNIHPHQRFPL
jgi:GxxExxY protein